MNLPNRQQLDIACAAAATPPWLQYGRIRTADAVNRSGIAMLWGGITGVDQYAALGAVAWSGLVLVCLAAYLEWRSQS